MKSFDNEEILFCDNHLLIALKPAGMLTQPGASMEESLETFAKAWVKQEYHKEGAVFIHAIHRLDRPVSGLVLFARTSKALSRLNEQSRLLQIQRCYIAEVEGILPEEGIKWMQEGSRKDRKGYTDGFNACLSLIRDKIKELK